MKYSVTNENTKKMFAASLTKFLQKKSLSKITVKEIIDDCGVNHKTFYYHFQDIYDLVHWMLKKETVEVVEKMNILTEYDDAIKYILDYVRENNHILNCLFDSMGKQQFSIFFYNDFVKRIRLFIDNYIEENDFDVDEKYIEFLCDFYTKALAEILIDWLKNKEKLPEEQLIDYIVTTFKVSVLAVLNNEKEKQKKLS